MLIRNNNISNSRMAHAMRENRERSSLKANNGRDDFRENLVSIFVDNLNPVVDQKGLWGIFKSFGLVRDLHLSLV